MCAFHGKFDCLKRLILRLLKSLYSEKYSSHCLLLEEAKQSIVGFGRLSSVIVLFKKEGLNFQQLLSNFRARFVLSIILWLFSVFNLIVLFCVFSIVLMFVIISFSLLFLVMCRKFEVKNFSSSFVLLYIMILEYLMFLFRFSNIRWIKCINFSGILSFMNIRLMSSVIVSFGL